MGGKMLLDVNRKCLEHIDKQIVQLLSDRMYHSKIIGEIKKNLNIPIYDEIQEVKVYEKLAKLSEKYEVNPELIARIYKLIMEESRKVQE